MGSYEGSDSGERFGNGQLCKTKGGWPARLRLPFATLCCQSILVGESLQEEWRHLRLCHARIPRPSGLSNTQSSCVSETHRDRRLFFRLHLAKSARQ